MKKFGSLKKITESSIEELETIIPHNVAINLKEYLTNFKNNNKDNLD